MFLGNIVSVRCANARESLPEGHKSCVLIPDKHKAIPAMKRAADATNNLRVCVGIVLSTSNEIALGWTGGDGGII